MQGSIGTCSCMEPGQITLFHQKTNSPKIRSRNVFLYDSKSDNFLRIFAYPIVHCALARLHCALGRFHCALGRLHCALARLHCALGRLPYAPGRTNKKTRKTKNEKTKNRTKMNKHVLPSLHLPAFFWKNVLNCFAVCASSRRDLRNRFFQIKTFSVKL